MKSIYEKSIDEIMDMLDWNNDEKIQRQGIELGKEIKNFNVFIQPCNEQHSKDVWDNCAEIIYNKTTKELIPYLNELIWWIKDLNWPGALVIEKKLKEMKSNKIVKQKLNEYIEVLQNNERKVTFLENLIEVNNSK